MLGKTKTHCRVDGRMSSQICETHRYETCQKHPAMANRRRKHFVPMSKKPSCSISQSRKVLQKQIDVSNRNIMPGDLATRILRCQNSMMCDFSGCRETRETIQLLCWLKRRRQHCNCRSWVAPGRWPSRRGRWPGRCGPPPPHSSTPRPRPPCR